MFSPNWGKGDMSGFEVDQGTVNGGCTVVSSKGYALHSQYGCAGVAICHLTPYCDAVKQMASQTFLKLNSYNQSYKSLLLQMNSAIHCKL